MMKPLYPDPYYGGPDGFDTVLNCIEDSCTGLTVRWSFDKPTDSKKKDSRGITHLMHACIRNNTELAKALLDQGADPNQKDSHGITALSIACKNNNMKLVQTLLVGKANPKVVDSFGVDVLTWLALKTLLKNSKITN